MASVQYSDPYQGWSAVNRCSNVTAYQIMTDTSWRWQLVWSCSGFRFYRG